MIFMNNIKRAVLCEVFIGSFSPFLAHFAKKEAEPACFKVLVIPTCKFCVKRTHKTKAIQAWYVYTHTYTPKCWTKPCYVITKICEHKVKHCEWLMEISIEGAVINKLWNEHENSRMLNHTHISVLQLKKKHPNSHDLFCVSHWSATNDYFHNRLICLLFYWLINESDKKIFPSLY